VQIPGSSSTMKISPAPVSPAIRHVPPAFPVSATRLQAEITLRLDRIWTLRASNAPTRTSTGSNNTAGRGLPIASPSRIYTSHPRRATQINEQEHGRHRVHSGLACRAASDAMRRCRLSSVGAAHRSASVDTPGHNSPRGWRRQEQRGPGCQQAASLHSDSSQRLLRRAVALTLLLWSAEFSW
jgi:hypothetical protein